MANKGAAYERQLVKRLTAVGWWPQRAAASGSATTNDLPDVHAGKDGTSVSIEAKYRSKNAVRLAPEEIEALEAHAAAFGSHALVACRWARDRTWYFREAEKLPRTPSGNYSARPSEARDEQWTDGPDALQAVNSDEAWAVVS
jgi:Holliday junction resolvase